MKRLFNTYIDTFKGLSKEIWWLALITFINRAGTMVIPFLSLYLTEDLNFSFNNVAWIMSAFGLGSVVGSWLGGKLTDKIGYYKVMVRSLLTTGFLFIGLQYLKTFELICLGIFLVMLVADMFRPAIFVAMSAYSKPENKTRSVTLIRLAINLGFSAGPAIGGLIIATIGYDGLFWVDGITCLLATLFLINVLHPKKAKAVDSVINENPQSVFKDKAFWIFFFAMVLFGIAFLQYFSTMPLYYRDRYELSEFEIGLLLGMNGLVIFVLEMPLISWLEGKKHSKTGLILLGTLLTGLSFIILNYSSWSGILVIAMLLMTLGEMVAFPFSNALVIDLSKKGKMGEYMAAYTISFSIAHIFGHNIGLQMVDALGYDNTWFIITGICLACIALLVLLKRQLKITGEE
ncbi:MFS transporter [Ichthyenterobacterium sp. W332]|uniref:MFS transporter n=1 Tax=Microcosmobacter mediterraneus TaxID=3075607 RepID=A0ABU2YG12_9FLAO|nr:MFS transporter [Ichthyenterobacterium sp. W332]MDT0557119.1 MFS transporter [Ichthyenterobacterium sp. W332]